MKLFEALVVICCENIEIVHTEIMGSFIDGDLRSDEISRETITGKDVHKFKEADERGKMHVVGIKPINSKTIEICYTSAEN